MPVEQEKATSTTMFRPPLARGMKNLDRTTFQKIVPLKAARIFENKNISKTRAQLESSKDALREDRLMNVRPDPDVSRARQGKKCVVLRPEVPAQEAHAMANGDSSHPVNGTPEAGVPWPHSRTVSELVRQELISVIPYDLNLDYGYWTYHDIISSILPLEAHSEIPSGFSQVGHVAHLNLREGYLPYKYLIAEILIDKNPGVKTVINKINDVGEENEFRTFRYEVLAGPDDLNVTVSESNCTFVFDYSKVYWNTRLNTEHKRLVDKFQEGEAVCDVMAGIGPFAVPAGKKRVFAWANDLNPDSFGSLTDAIRRNKVQDFVKPFNSDGRDFIRDATLQLLDSEYNVEIKSKVSRQEIHAGGNPAVLKTVTRPKTFQHFVLNLPASALEFLPSFIGLYTCEMQERLPTGVPMPIVHVYCFNTKDELEDSKDRGKDAYDRSGVPLEATPNGNGSDGAVEKICKQISEYLQYDMGPGNIEEVGGIEVWDVRDVAPKKRMFCASFRLPKEVAFRRQRKDGNPCT